MSTIREIFEEHKTYANQLFKLLELDPVKEFFEIGIEVLSES